MVSTGTDTAALLALTVAAPALAMGTIAVVRVQPDIRHTRQDARRWISQAGGAALAATAGWVAWFVASRILE